MKHLMIPAACAAIFIVSTSPVQAKEVPEKTNINIAAASTGLTYLPLLIAESRGYFKNQGLNVTIAAFSGGSKALEALLGGSSDVVAGAYSHTITLETKSGQISEGQHLVNFAVQVNCPGWIFGVATKDAGTIKSIKDLKGKSVGVSAPGSSTHMVVNYMLHTAGLAPNDVSIVGVGQAAGAVAAIKAGQINALIVNDPVATLLQKEGDVKVLRQLRNPEETKQILGGSYPEASLYTTRDFIKKNPKTVQALTNGIVEAERWIAKATPEEVVNAVPKKYMVGDKSLYAQAFQNSRECISKNALMPKDGPEVVEKVLAAFLPSVGKAHINLSATYTNSFAEKADKGSGQ